MSLSSSSDDHLVSVHVTCEQCRSELIHFALFIQYVNITTILFFFVVVLTLGLDLLLAQRKFSGVSLWAKPFWVDPFSRVKPVLNDGYLPKH